MTMPQLALACHSSAGLPRSKQRARTLSAPMATRRLPILLGTLVTVGTVALGLALCQAATAPFPAFAPAAAADYVQSVSIAVQDVVGTHADLPFAQARVLSVLGQTDDALRLARLALAIDPQRADIRLFLGELFVAQDRLPEAELNFRLAAELDPALPGVQRRLGMTLDRLGDRAAAQRAFEDAVTRQPTDATARLLLGRLLLDTDRAQDALVQLTKACELNPTSPNPYYALAQAQTRLDNRDQARVTLQKFNELKRQEQQAADTRNLSRDDTQNVEALVATFHTDLATVFLRRGQAEPAEDHLRQAIALAPDQALAYSLLATHLFQTQRAPIARPLLEELVRLDPADLTYRVNLGTLLLQLGEPEPAVEHLTHALQLDPNQPEALNNLARFFLGQRRNLADALEYSRRLAATHPIATSFDLLGWAAFANGLLEEARAATARAAELDPANPVYRQRLERLETKP